MKRQNEKLIIVGIIIVLILVFICLFTIFNMIRDHYCFTSPFDEVKQSKICEVYLNEK